VHSHAHASLLGGLTAK